MTTAVPPFDPDFDDTAPTDDWTRVPIAHPSPRVHASGYRIERARLDSADVFGRPFRLSPPLECRLLFDPAGRMWMSSTPQEHIMMANNARRSSGHVLVGGLGLGLYPQYAQTGALGGATRFTIVERSPVVRDLVEPALRASLRVPFEVVVGDVGEYLTPCPPSLAGKGERQAQRGSSPLLQGEGSGERSVLPPLPLCGRGARGEGSSSPSTAKRERGQGGEGQADNPPNPLSPTLARDLTVPMAREGGTTTYDRASRSLSRRERDGDSQGEDGPLFDTIFLDTWDTLDAAILPEVNRLRDLAMARLEPGGRVLLWGYRWMVRLFEDACRELLAVRAADRSAWLDALRTASPRAAAMLEPVAARFAGENTEDLAAALAWCRGYVAAVT